MKYVLNSAQMKACDKGTIEFFGVPSLVLMERAALAVVEEVEKKITKKDTIHIVYRIFFIKYIATYKTKILYQCVFF